MFVWCSMVGVYVCMFDISEMSETVNVGTRLDPLVKYLKALKFKLTLFEFSANWGSTWLSDRKDCSVTSW